MISNVLCHLCEGVYSEKMKVSKDVSGDQRLFLSSAQISPHILSSCSSFSLGSCYKFILAIIE